MGRLSTRVRFWTMTAFMTFSIAMLLAWFCILLYNAETKRIDKCHYEAVVHLKPATVVNLDPEMNTTTDPDVAPSKITYEYYLESRERRNCTLSLPAFEVQPSLGTVEKIYVSIEGKCSYKLGEEGCYGLGGFAFFVVICACLSYIGFIISYYVCRSCIPRRHWHYFDNW